MLPQIMIYHAACIPEPESALLFGLKVEEDPSS